jgi:hypothetical protein
MSTDGTPDANGRKVSNITGVSKTDQTLSEKSSSLSCQEMSAVNHTKTASVVSEAMQTVARWREI